MPKTKYSEFKKQCPICNKDMYYANDKSLNTAIKANRKCISCARNGIKTKKDHPETVTKICDYCEQEFTVTWKYRKQLFCSGKCANGTRHDLAWVIKKCKNCGKEFNSRIKNNTIFCSTMCALTSESKKDALREWIIDNNPMNNESSRQKISKKLKGRNVGFGSPNKPNTHTQESKDIMSDNAKINYELNGESILEKRDETYMEKYGMTCGEYLLIQSRGCRISKGQQKLYEDILIRHPDALLEHYLSDIRKNVDIFIPSINKVVEYYGGYWHCDPNIYNENYYNETMKLYANEVWARDYAREKVIRDAGYDFEIVWESM